MRKEMDVLRFLQMLAISLPAFPAKRRSLRIPCYKLIPEIMACVSCFAAIFVAAGGLSGTGNVQINLLSEFRPIGSAGNNLNNPDFNAVPGSPELALAEYENIVYTDYLPVLTGPVLGPYGGYDPTVNSDATVLDRRFPGGPFGGIVDAGGTRPQRKRGFDRGCATGPAELTRAVALEYLHS